MTLAGFTRRRDVRRVELGGDGRDVDKSVSSGPLIHQLKAVYPI